MMPPRKKPRLSTSRGSSIPGTSPAASPISPSALSPAATAPANSNTSYWPLAAQTALFKALIASKPTGPHKHFHLLTIAHAISSELGYYIPIEQIRDKVSELYDLEQLDRREQEYAFRVRDKRGDWMPEVHESVFVLPGVPRMHGGKDEDIGSDERDAADKEAIASLFEAKDADDAFFIDAVWKRRFPDGVEEEAVMDDASEEASPVPSNVTGSRKGRQTRGTRLSEIKAEDEDEDGGDNAEDDDDEHDGGTPQAKKSTRASARTRKGKKR